MTRNEVELRGALFYIKGYAGVMAKSNPKQWQPVLDRIDQTLQKVDKDEVVR